MHLSNYLNGGLSVQMGSMGLYMIMMLKRLQYILMSQLKSAMLDQSNGMMRKTEFIEKIIIIKWGINIVRKICEAIKSYNVNFMTVREILWF